MLRKSIFKRKKENTTELDKINKKKKNLSLSEDDISSSSSDRATELQTRSAGDAIEKARMTMKKLSEGFQDGNIYAAYIENWVNDSMFGEPLEHTFASDFVRADYMFGEKGVRDTCELVKMGLLDNYKAWTEVILAINHLSLAQDHLKKQGYEGRDPFIQLYIKLYHQSVNDFYEKYENDPEKCEYFFQMTD